MDYLITKNNLDTKISGGGERFGGAKSAEQIKAIDEAISKGDVDQTVTGFNDGNKVYFDHKNGTSSVSLSDEAMNKIRAHFDDKDFHQREDGSIILSGEAERFVSGWYSDVAYTMGFIAANAGNKPDLSDLEVAKVKMHNIMNFTSRGEVIIQSNEDFKAFSQAEQRMILVGSTGKKNINSVISNVILRDSNFDGNLSAKEELGALARGLYGASDNNAAVGLAVLSSALKNSDNFKNSIMDLLNPSSIKDADKKRELQAAAASASLPRIRAQIEQKGASSISLQDKELLDVLKINPSSYEKQHLKEPSQADHAQLASLLQVSKEQLDGKSNEQISQLADAKNSLVNELLDRPLFASKYV